MSAALSSSSSTILNLRALGSGPMPTLDPFLFCVYHKDEYPPSINDKMEAPRTGNGQDFDSQPYKMYHGKRVPGFPQHPHRGFETITATMDGIIDHADSVGNAGRYGMGDLQWMTAGRGVVHSEMFPLIKQQQNNPTRFFQIWLNLPAAQKMVDPGFAMFWAHQVPVYKAEKATVTVWCGQDYFGIETNNAPPPNSWASNLENDVAIWHVVLQPGASLTLPAAHKASQVNRSLFFVQGDKGKMTIDETVLDASVVVDVQADRELLLVYDASATQPGEFLLLQGRPLNEPVEQYGPFVMNTEAEINAAFADYQRTQFGGWPWPRDDMVFPRESGRFAKLNGTKSEPPDAVCLADE